MSDNQVVALAVMVMVVCALGVGAIVGYQDRIADQEAAKAGLQQCVIGRKIVWQRECKSNE